MKKDKLGAVIGLVAVCMVLYHLANCYFSIVGTIEHRMIHLGFALSLVLLVAMKASKRPLILLVVLLVSLGSIGYLWFNLEWLLSNMGFPEWDDVIVGFLMLVVVFWACWLSFGPVLPILAFILLLYGFFGYHLGAPILSVKEVITTVCLTFGSYDLWGKILIVSANVLFLFIVYGGLLKGLGATDFFIQLGRMMGKSTRSGPAMAAVGSSALMGMTTGQATPNIAVTGAFTIPLMKKVGYKPAVAGAIEAASSGGGQIMPPIMGAGAFVMADILSVPYSKIILVALVPALLYFFAVAVFVHLHAYKQNVMPLGEKVDRKNLYAFGPLFLIPLASILTLLFLGYPAVVGAFWGIAALVLLSLIRKRTRPGLGTILNGCVDGATTGSRVAVACATLGPIIALMTKTGLGLKVAYSVEMWSGGNLFLGLLILMATVIILGLEVPTVAAYLIAAVVAIPPLVRLGLDPFQAHLFAFYFGAFSGLTPPVGMSAIVASKMADAPYIKTAFLSINAAVGGFVIPFVFVFNGALLLLPGTSFLSAFIAIGGVLLGLGIFQAGFVGYLSTTLMIWERVLAIISGLGFLTFVAVGNYLALVMAAILVTPVILFSWRRGRLVNASS